MYFQVHSCPLSWNPPKGPFKTTIVQTKTPVRFYVSGLWYSEFAHFATTFFGGTSPLSFGALPQICGNTFFKLVVPGLQIDLGSPCLPLDAPLFCPDPSASPELGGFFVETTLTPATTGLQTLTFRDINGFSTTPTSYSPFAEGSTAAYLLNNTTFSQLFG